MLTPGKLELFLLIWIETPFQDPKLICSTQAIDSVTKSFFKWWSLKFCRSTIQKKERYVIHVQSKACVLQINFQSWKGNYLNFTNLTWSRNNLQVQTKQLQLTYSVDMACTSSSVCFPLSANLDRFFLSRIFFLSLSNFSLMISTLLGWMPTLTVAPFAFSRWILSMWITL